MEVLLLFPVKTNLLAANQNEMADTSSAPDRGRDGRPCTGRLPRRGPIPWRRPILPPCPSHAWRVACADETETVEGKTI